MQVPAELVKELASLSDRFYGDISINIQDGQAVIIKTTKTTKIYNERDTRNGFSR